MSVELTVVIPGYNRLEPLKHTLASAARAAAALPTGAVEILLVDDGSTPPLAEALRGFAWADAVRHLRQPNQGSIIARLTGLAAAKGTYILFLDSDDLVHPDKFRAQVRALEESQADVAYADMAVAELGATYGEVTYRPADNLPATADPAELYLRIQPVPHNPIYRRRYLEATLRQPLIPPDRAMDCVGDVWLYYNLAPFPARVCKAAGPFSAVGPHEEARFSRHWEKLGLAALKVAEAFLARCPQTDATLTARTIVGECAFRSWRALPLGYNADYDRRLLSVWQNSPHGSVAKLGEAKFQQLSSLIGPVLAGRLLRRLRNAPYDKVRTLSVAEYHDLFGANAR